MKRKLIINGKEYEMPKMDVDNYMEYLEVRDDIMGTEKKSGLYTAEQFRKMLDCICMVYGNQFTVDELKDKETGLGVAAIIMEFALIEESLGDEVNGKVEKLQKNFTLAADHCQAEGAAISLIKYRADIKRYRLSVLLIFTFFALRAATGASGAARASASLFLPAY